MGLAFIVFLFVVVLIVGSYFAITALPGMMAQRELDKRLKDVSFTDSSGEAEESSVLQKIVEGPMPIVDKFVKDSKQGSGLARLIEQSGVHTTPSGLMLVTLISAAVVGWSRLCSSNSRTPRLSRPSSAPRCRCSSS